MKITDIYIRDIYVLKICYSNVPTNVCTELQARMNRGNILCKLLGVAWVRG